jgi:hypothetical protein
MGVLAAAWIGTGTAALATTPLPHYSYTQPNSAAPLQPPLSATRQGGALNPPLSATQQGGALNPPLSYTQQGGALHPPLSHTQLVNVFAPTPQPLFGTPRLATVTGGSTPGATATRGWAKSLTNLLPMSLKRLWAPRRITNMPAPTVTRQP